MKSYIQKMVYKATKNDIKDISELAILMWNGHTKEELEKQFLCVMEKGDSVIFLLSVDEKKIGFAQCGLRYDYVEGTSSSPVGYLEGIFIKEEFRNKGFAKELLEACETWVKEQGCSEFASDCELDNDISLKFHLKMEFEEANRIICFKKQL